MGCGAAEATVLVFFCFVVPNPFVLSTIGVCLGFSFINFPILLPPPQTHSQPPASPGSGPGPGPGYHGADAAAARPIAHDCFLVGGVMVFVIL